MNENQLGLESVFCLCAHVTSPCPNWKAKLPPMNENQFGPESIFYLRIHVTSPCPNWKAKLPPMNENRSGSESIFYLRTHVTSPCPNWCCPGPVQLCCGTAAATACGHATAGPAASPPRRWCSAPRWAPGATHKRERVAGVGARLGTCPHRATPSPTRTRQPADIQVAAATRRWRRTAYVAAASSFTISPEGAALTAVALGVGVGVGVGVFPRELRSAALRPPPLALSAPTLLPQPTQRWERWRSTHPNCGGLLSKTGSGRSRKKKKKKEEEQIKGRAGGCKGA